MSQIVRNGIIYGGSSNNSKEIYYNNDSSELESTNIQDAIDEIDNNLKNIDSITIPCNYINSKKEFTVFKIGKICFVDFYAFTGLSVSENTTIAVLPEEYRPISEVIMDTVVPGSTNVIRIALKPEGEIMVYNYTQSTGAINIRAHIVYLCK